MCCAVSVIDEPVGVQEPVLGLRLLLLVHPGCEPAGCQDLQHQPHLRVPEAAELRALAGIGAYPVGVNAEHVSGWPGTAFLM